MSGQGWQPIATAPQDGEFVLLAGHHPNHGWVQKVWTFFAGQWWSNGHGVAPTMSHWMPLPEAPEVGS